MKSIISTTAQPKFNKTDFKNIKLEELKKGLMQQLLIGKIRVN